MIWKMLTLQQVGKVKTTTTTTKTPLKTTMPYDFFKKTNIKIKNWKEIHLNVGVGVAGWSDDR